MQDNKVRENGGDAWQPIAIMQGTGRYAHNWRRYTPVRFPSTLTQE